nr:uncharacterized protein LOC122268418 [Parasteatoda tepidariorum]
MRPTSMPSSFCNQVPWHSDRSSPDDFDQQHWIILSNSDFVDCDRNSESTTNTNTNFEGSNSQSSYVSSDTESPMSPSHPDASVSSKSSRSYNYFTKLITELKETHGGQVKNSGDSRENSIEEFHNAFAAVEQSSPGITDTFVKEIFRRLAPHQSRERKMHNIIGRLKVSET